MTNVDQRKADAQTFNLQSLPGYTLTATDSFCLAPSTCNEKNINEYNIIYNSFPLLPSLTSERMTRLSCFFFVTNGD